MEWANKPFHESVVDAIAAAATPDEFEMLSRLILTTKIPKNHDVIREAWRASAIDRNHPDNMVTMACIIGKKEQAKPENESVEMMFGSLEPGDRFPNPSSGFLSMAVETEVRERHMAVYLEGPLVGRRCFIDPSTRVQKKVQKGT